MPEVTEKSLNLGTLVLSVEVRGHPPFDVRTRRHRWTCSSAQELCSLALRGGSFSDVERIHELVTMYFRHTTREGGTEILRRFHMAPEDKTVLDLLRADTYLRNGYLYSSELSNRFRADNRDRSCFNVRVYRNRNLNEAEMGALGVVRGASSPIPPCSAPL